MALSTISESFKSLAEALLSKSEASSRIATISSHFLKRSFKPVRLVSRVAFFYYSRTRAWQLNMLRLTS